MAPPARACHDAARGHGPGDYPQHSRSLVLDPQFYTTRLVMPYPIVLFLRAEHLNEHTFTQRNQLDTWTGP